MTPPGQRNVEPSRLRPSLESIGRRGSPGTAQRSRSQVGDVGPSVTLVRPVRVSPRGGGAKKEPVGGPWDAPPASGVPGHVASKLRLAPRWPAERRRRRGGRTRRGRKWLFVNPSSSPATTPGPPLPSRLPSSPIRLFNSHSPPIWPAIKGTRSGIARGSLSPLVQGFTTLRQQSCSSAPPLLGLAQEHLARTKSAGRSLLRLRRVAFLLG